MVALREIDVFVTREEPVPAVVGRPDDVGTLLQLAPRAVEVFSRALGTVDVEVDDEFRRDVGGAGRLRKTAVAHEGDLHLHGQPTR